MLRVEGAVKAYEPAAGWLRGLVRTAASTTVPALDGVDLTVAAGEVVGLLGPNGAGKSTLIKIIAGLLEADEGTVTFDGASSVKERQAAMGLVLADDRGLYWRLDGRQNLEFFGRLQGLSRREASARATAAAAAVELDLVGTRVFGYSSGMKARLNLARALVHEPRLLILDEPTRSLDPVVSEQIGHLIRGQADAGRGVLMSSHRLDEAVEWCDRLVVIVDGRIRFSGTTADLVHDPGGELAALRRVLAEPEDGGPP